MRNARYLAVVAVALFALVCGQTAVAKDLPNVMILATGGTIAGAAATGTQSGYTSGAVGIEGPLAARCS